MKKMMGITVIGCVLLVSNLFAGEFERIQNLVNRTGQDDQTFQVPGDSNVTLINILDTPGYAFKPFFKDNLVYIADGLSGLQIVDISVISAPQLIGSVDTPGQAYAVVVSDTLAFVADNDSGLRVISVSNPQNPVEIASHTTDDRAVSIAIKGNILFIADGAAGLKVFDVSNPSSPQLIGSHPTIDFYWDVAVNGNILCAANSNDGLRILDISTPAYPIELSWHPTPGEAIAVEMNGEYAYVADLSSGVRVIDINPPHLPFLKDFIETDQLCLDLKLSNNFIYAADNGDGVYVIDVSNPVNISVIGRYNTTGNARGIESDIDKIFVADGSKGLVILNDEQTFVKNIPTGWSLLGMPLDIFDTFFLSTFPQTIPPMYRWTINQYQRSSVFELGDGYFLYYPVDSNILIQGKKFANLTLNLNRYWNMISTISDPVPLASVSDPGLIIVPPVYEFKTTYVRVDTLKPSVGYWVYASSTGQIIISSSGAIPKNRLAVRAPDMDGFPKLSVSEAGIAEQDLYFETNRLEETNPGYHFYLPPSPPVGFDARFTDNRWITNHSSAEIEITCSTGLASFTASGLPEGMCFVIVETRSGTQYVVYNSIQIQVKTAPVERFKVSILKMQEQNVLLPSTFSVMQNYPNPFNQSTIIRFEISEKAYTRVSVFNVLGQKVTDLFAGVIEPGYYTVSWDGTDTAGRVMATGIYYYEVKSGNRYSIKKMILSK